MYGLYIYKCNLTSSRQVLRGLEFQKIFPYKKNTEYLVLGLSEQIRPTENEHCIAYVISFYSQFVPKKKYSILSENICRFTRHWRNIAYIYFLVSEALCLQIASQESTIPNTLFSIYYKIKSLTGRKVRSLR